MGETLKNWAKKYESGSTKELPEWIPTDELPFWEQFLRIHPELIEPTERKTSLAKKLANGRPLTPNILLEFGVDTIDKFLEYMGRAVGCVSKALNSIRSASIRNRDLRFTSLFHHINEPLLTEAFNKLRKEAAPGCDRKTWDEYEKNLVQNIKNLKERIISWSYYPKPVRRVYIPKASGGMRPLGICAIEDKIVQNALKMILEEIYEPKFVGVSYGFRPNTRAHDALDAVYVAITEKNVNYILDADIVGCFDNINRQLLVEILNDGIGDQRILRLISRLINAGILEEGELKVSEDGVIQGSTLSPLLANIFFDYVLDKFIIWWRKTFAKGEVYYVRYADDYILCFQYKEDAETLLRVLSDRLLCAGLRLNAKKTRLIKFGKFARSINGSTNQADTETFDFLGFTHKCGITWKGRKFKLIRNCISDRINKKLVAIEDNLKEMRFGSIERMILWINSVLKGYYAYFAVPDNTQPLSSFRFALMKIVYKRLHRLSQRCKWTWERFNALLAPKIAFPRVKHPYPNQRFAERQEKLNELRDSVPKLRII